MKIRAFGLATLLLAILLCSSYAETTYTPPLRSKDFTFKSDFPWKRNIVTTYFWIGQGCTTISDTTNYSSAWDQAWTRNFGGIDSPFTRIMKRCHGGKVSLPRKFAPTLNPFYVALPFNDVKYPSLARKYVPWWSQKNWNQNRQSQCKGRWVAIEYQGKIVFAQWEDVGPLRYDHVGYVFGNERPNIFNGAGLDVSPAVRDYLGLDGLNRASWRFVEAEEVPYGPWVEYGEQAVLYSVIKKETQRKSKL